MEISAADVAIFASVVIGAAYYFFVHRKKNDDEFKIKPMTISHLKPTGDTQSSSSGFVEKMKHSKRNVVAFYGSQTGTAEEFANQMAKDATRYGMKGMSCDPEEEDMEQLEGLRDIDNNLVIFCLATYGEGDPTDNAHDFIELLKGDDISLEGVNYAVFGLGNKTYEHYNAIATLADERLSELGGTRVYPLGLGDDDANIEEDFVGWCENFWPTVCEHFGVDAHASDVKIRQYRLSEPENVPSDRLFTGEPARLGSFKKQRPPFDQKNPYMAQLLTNKELHNGGGRSCRHIEFSIKGSRLRYEAGDHVAVFPTNPKELVESLAARLNIDLDRVFALTAIDSDASKKNPFPCPCTYRTALTHYLDICSPPRTHVLREIADYASEEDRQFLRKLASADGKEDYQNWITDARRHILAVLEDLPSIQPPVDHLCELLPRLQARYYSIASSPKMHPESIHIAAGVVKYETPTGRTMKGVATNYLAELEPSECTLVPIFVRKSSFKLPFRPSVPILMIGPGTGLAPFRGFIQERHVSKIVKGQPIGTTVLFSGCRNKEHDYIYEGELQGFLNDESLSNLFCAFSRDQDHKIYVQHLLSKQADLVWQVLDNGGHIYVCGDARHMAPDVLHVLHQIIASKSKCSEDEAVEFMKKLHQRGRYSADVWT